jgi:hypothetical protein
MPAWSDLTGADTLNGDQLPRRDSDYERQDSFYGSQIPRQNQPPSQERSFDPYSTQPPAGSVPISAVPVSAVPVSVPPTSIPAPSAPPVWPPVADEPHHRDDRSSQGIYNADRSAPQVVPQHLPYADETMELPIFRELESAWFSTRRTAMEDAGTTTPTIGEQDLTITAQFSAVDPYGYSGQATGANGDASTSKDEMVTAQAGRGSAGRVAQGAESVPAAYRPTWQTAADEGWAAATAAASSDVNETTMSGLPKRTPMAQLVPGGVDKGSTNLQRRSPEGVRGLLSAYHRGVQRGRTQHVDDDVSPGSTETGGPTGKEHEA